MSVSVISADKQKIILHFFNYKTRLVWLKKVSGLKTTWKPGLSDFVHMYEGLSKVRRLMQWNQYFLRYAYRFCTEYKTTNVLSVVKIQNRDVDN